MSERTEKSEKKRPSPLSSSLALFLSPSRTPNNFAFALSQDSSLLKQCRPLSGSPPRGWRRYGGHPGPSAGGGWVFDRSVEREGERESKNLSTCSLKLLPLLKINLNPQHLITASHNALVEVHLCAGRIGTDVRPGLCDAGEEVFLLIESLASILTDGKHFSAGRAQPSCEEQLPQSRRYGY